MMKASNVLDASDASPAPLVLIAEDDPTAAGMLKSFLRRVGYGVRHAADGAKALEMLEETPMPDVMLLDWMLPEMTGLEVCRQVRERWDAITLPILMVTAKADPESVSAAFRAGASDYITKPFLGAELRARVAAHLRIKQLVDERRRMDEHLMEREKLSTLGLLVSGVAHDLKNPLGGIYGYAQLLLEQESDPEKLVALERIVSEVQRCNRIAADLLSFARRQAPTRSVIDVSEILAQTVGLRERYLLANGINTQLQIEPHLPMVRADAHQLQQVFLNILLNAEHAVQQQGSVVRITAGRDLERENGTGGMLTIRFFNDGPPIPPGVLSRIFDPFFTTKGDDGGTGLGLPICRRIVQEHGGTIHVASGPEGTTFAISLPPEEPSIVMEGHSCPSRMAS